MLVVLLVGPEPGISADARLPVEPRRVGLLFEHVFAYVRPR
jgi:hypothetical protein